MACATVDWQSASIVRQRDSGDAGRDTHLQIAIHQRIIVDGLGVDMTQYDTYDRDAVLDMLSEPLAVMS